MKNIMVYALGRSGSTWLVSHLAKIHNLEPIVAEPYGSEIYHPRFSAEQKQSHWRQVTTSPKYVIKILASHASDLTDFYGYCDHVYFNARRDLTDSVLSWYIAIQTRNWHDHFSNETLIPFDRKMLQMSLANSLLSRKKFVSVLHEYNHTDYSLVFTEDLPQQDKLKRPVNIERYDDIVAYIKGFEHQDAIAAYTHFDPEKIIKFDTDK
jgi:hypothetical protein